MNCNNCGKQLSENSQFCPNCGIKNEQNEIQVNSEINNQSVINNASSNQTNNFNDETYVNDTNIVNNNFNQTPVRVKEKTYWQKILFKDTLVLLILSILGVIIGFIFKTELAAGLTLRSFLMFIPLLIILCTIKNLRKEIIIFSIITSVGIIFLSLIDTTILDVIYIILSIFNIIHCAKCLKTVNTKIQNIDIENNIKNKGKIFKILPYVFCFLSIVSLIGFTIIKFSSIGIEFEQFIEKNNSYIFILSLLSLVFSISTSIFAINNIIKKYSSVFTYICFVISIFVIIISGFIFVGSIYDYNYYNSGEYHTDNYEFEIEDFKDNITRAVSNPLFLMHLNAASTEDFIITFGEYKKISGSLDDNLDFSAFEQLEKLGITCDGYIVLKLKSDSTIEEYKKVLEQYLIEGNYDMKLYFESIDVYMNCSGKYNYKTIGYDKNYLNYQ